MSAELKWTKRTGKHLEDLYDYLSVKNELAAVKCYRSLVACKHYKIVYHVDDTIVKIVAVWDCRQDSRKLKNML